MVELDPDRFLNELGKLFDTRKALGPVRITMKRSNMKPRKSRFPQTDAEYKCLIRATAGNKKISTAVSASQHKRFQSSYDTILKAQLDALKKREKTKSKSGKK
ncbi:hypothetical protein WJX73_008983 [Symbiochloris irregularis]|uniref:Signal recognition particle 14 kDa protein n=1 Tax=Symbiochloris irregularis TaxID=706552 RepID=A0AAW1NMY6_9CHLO